METIKLSDEFTVYKLKASSYNKDEFIDRAYQVIKLKKTHPTDRNHFFYIPFRCYEFDRINEIILNTCRNLNNGVCNEYAIQNWVYFMTNKSENEIYHTHIDLIEGDPRIKTDWTFCFYLQIPDGLNDDDGKIAFKTEDGVEHLFLPEEGDIYLFPPNLLHTPKLIKNATDDRIVIAGNVSLNPLKAINNKSLT
jgi:hypothetical protein